MRLYEIELDGVYFHCLWTHVWREFFGNTAQILAYKFCQWSASDHCRWQQMTVCCDQSGHICRPKYTWLCHNIAGDITVCSANFRLMISCSVVKIFAMKFWKCKKKLFGLYNVKSRDTKKVRLLKTWISVWVLHGKLWCGFHTNFEGISQTALNLWPIFES